MIPGSTKALQAGAPGRSGCRACASVLHQEYHMTLTSLQQLQWQGWLC